MTSSRNRTIVDLSRWASEPEKMFRFEQLALLTQRTSFLKQLLALSDHDDVIRMQIEAVCKKNEVACNFPRGAMFEGDNSKSVTTAQRYALSFLLVTLLGTSHGGMGVSLEGLDAENLIDRLIYTYRRYLATVAASPSTADVNFEMFYAVFKAYKSGKADLIGCENCDSTYLTFRLAGPMHCPLCAIHKHAELSKPKRQRPTVYFPESSDGDTGVRWPLARTSV